MSATSIRLLYHEKLNIEVRISLVLEAISAFLRMMDAWAAWRVDPLVSDVPVACSRPLSGSILPHPSALCFSIRGRPSPGGVFNSLERNQDAPIVLFLHVVTQGMRVVGRGIKRLYFRLLCRGHI